MRKLEFDVRNMLCSSSVFCLFHVSMQLFGIGPDIDLPKFYKFDFSFFFLGICFNKKTIQFQVCDCVDVKGLQILKNPAGF